VARSTVRVLGVTFKQNCPDIRNSKVIDLINELKFWNVNVVVADPVTDAQEVREEYGIELTTIDATHKVDSLVVAVGHHEYRLMSSSELRSYCASKAPVLADVKALYNRHEAAAASFTVFRL